MDLTTLAPNRIVEATLDLHSEQYGTYAIRELGRGPVGAVRALGSLIENYHESSWGHERELIKQRDTVTKRLERMIEMHGETPEAEFHRWAMERHRTEVAELDTLLVTHRFMEEFLAENPWEDIDPGMVIEDDRARLVLTPAQVAIPENVFHGYLSTRPDSNLVVNLARVIN